MAKRRKKRRTSSRRSSQSIRDGVGKLLLVVVLISLGLVGLAAARNGSWTGLAIIMTLMAGLGALALYSGRSRRQTPQPGRRKKGDKNR